MRLIVLGLYNSGSTTLAGMLHRLGVNMGAPFWTTDEDDSPGNYYEPYDLSWHLRRWWDEPHVNECSTSADRIAFLRRWVELQETVGPATVGVKHPLLSLTIGDLLAAWGPQTRLLWSYRDLDASLAGLKRRGWYQGHETAIQHRLWESLHQAEAAGLPLIRIPWEQVKADPTATARRLAELAGVPADPALVERAAAFVRSG